MPDAKNASLTAADLRKLGISKPYAHQLASGSRKPSLAMALRIHDALGAKLGPLETATSAEIAALRRLADRQAGA